MDNNISSINFKGSYLINYKRGQKLAREAFEKSIGEHRKQIFESFDGKKDQVLYVLKNSKDYDAAQVVKQHNLKFKYMPEVTTKLKFDIEKPQEAIDYLSQNSPYTITKLDELNSYIEANRLKCRARYDIPKPVGPKKDFADDILKNLKIEIKGVKIKDSRGILKIKDKENDGIVVISPKSKFGISYVFHKPANKYEHESRYAVNEKGELLATFNTPDGIKKFKECFTKTLNNNKPL